MIREIAALGRAAAVLLRAGERILIKYLRFQP